MQITRREEYGLRGLLFLARQPDEKVFWVSEISKVQKIPESFLAKIFQRLSKGGTSPLIRGVQRAGFH